MDAPDFYDFKHWLKENPECYPWPDLTKLREALSEEQRQVVRRNAQLLGDRDDWNETVGRFERELAKVEETKRETVRSSYAIRFDQYEFPNRQIDFADRRFPCGVGFSSVKFGTGDVSFNGATFECGGVSFAGATFGEGSVSFVGATFGKGGVSFYGAEFHRGAAFDEVSFGDGDVSFSSAKFGMGNVSFDGAKFGEGEVSFSSVNWGRSKEVSFRKVSFGDGNVIFVDCNFGPRRVCLDDAKFGVGDVTFSRVEFGGAVYFNRTDFGDGPVSFTGARFGNGGTSFSEAQFGEGRLSFESANFGDGGVQFRDSIFGDEVSFDRAQFGNGNAEFSPIEVASRVSFRDAVAAGNFFVSAHFRDAAVFTRFAVMGTADFSDCSFDVVPDFRDAKFDRSPEVARMDVGLPVMTRRWLFRVAADRDDVAKFRKLKAMALAANDHERDGYFFAREMMAKRGTETRKWALIPDSIYWLISFYGQSVVRPLWWFLGSFFGFAAAYFAVLFAAMPRVPSAQFAIDYSARNTFPFVSTLFRFAAVPSEGTTYASGFQRTVDEMHAFAGDRLMDCVVILSVFQQAIGATLLFLLLLAVRNRFKMR